MQAEALRDPVIQKFDPVMLILTLETKKEVETLYALFNWSPICNWMHENVEDGAFASKLRWALDRLLPSINYSKAHKQLSAEFTRTVR